MITFTILLIFIWGGIGAYITGKFSYWFEDKYDWCGACIHYGLLMLWVFLSVGLCVDLSSLGIIK